MTLIEQALAPIFTGDPDDLDLFAHKVTFHVTSALDAAMLKVMSISRFKIKAFGSRDEEQNSWEGGYNHDMSYWASVEYPTLVLMNQKVKVDIARRWEEAVAAVSRNKFTAPPLTPQVIGYFAEWLQDNLGAPEGLSRAEEEDLLDRLFSHPSQGIETQAQMSETNSEGESEDHVESPDVDVRFRFAVDERNAKISAKPDRDSVILDITLPVKVRVSRIVGPWDNEYMNRRASLRVAQRYLNAGTTTAIFMPVKGKLMGFPTDGSRSKTLFQPSGQVQTDVEYTVQEIESKRLFMGKIEIIPVEVLAPTGRVVAFHAHGDSNGLILLDGPHSLMGRYRKGDKPGRHSGYGNSHTYETLQNLDDLAERIVWSVPSGVPGMIATQGAILCDRGSLHKVRNHFRDADRKFFLQETT